MASLREYRKKIKTVKSTEQITKAMKMVAAARLRQAQARILSARPFAIKMHELLTELAGRILSEENEAPSVDWSAPKVIGKPPHPLLQARESNKIGVLLITADKGLCGSFNTNLIKKASEFLKQNEKKEIHFFAVGRKGRDFFKRLGYPLAGEYVQIFNNLSYLHAEIIGKDLINAFLEHNLSEVVLIFNEFKTVVQQKLIVERLLPVSRPAKIAEAIGEHKTDFIYEPPQEDLLAALLPRYVKSQVFRALMESYAAELGARMSAMDSASKNARELIDMLTLKLNRTRQAIITREIAELVGGAEALK